LISEFCKPWLIGGRELMFRANPWVRRLVPTPFLSIALLFSTYAASAADERDCTLKQYASLDLAETSNGSLLVPVQIEDRSAYMVLNTVAAISALTEEAVRLLGLPTKPVPRGVEIHFGKSDIQRMASAKAFALGPVRYKGATFLITPTELVGRPTGGVPVVGTLGMDVFANMDVELDAAHRKLNLFSQDHCPGRAVYWAKKFDSVPIRVGKLGEIYFPMELDGQKLETTLATGSALTALSTEVTRKLYHFDKDSPDIEKETDASGETTAHYRAMALTGEGLQIINARIRLVDPTNNSCHLGKVSGAAAYEDCYGAHPLQLGRSVLTKLRIYIATKEKALYFTDADAHD
jgi:hypothetical protein